jgi:hypothetical protein
MNSTVHSEVMMDITATEEVPGWTKTTQRTEPKQKRQILRKSTKELPQNTGTFIPIQDSWIGDHPEMKVQREYAGHPITDWELIQNEDHEQFPPDIIRLQKGHHRRDDANHAWICLLCGTTGSTKSGLTGARLHHGVEVKNFNKRGFLPGQAPVGSTERSTGLFLCWLTQKGIPGRAATKSAEICEILRRDDPLRL